MKTEYFKEYSQCLGRDMEFKVYGHNGKPILVFPSQNGRFYDFENNGMLEGLMGWIEEGKIQLFCVDSNDLASWSSTSWDNRQRILAQEDYVHYIVNELVPRIWEICPWKDQRILTTGCSLGATHALNFFLRYPGIFSGCIALSGAYNANLFFNDYHDDLVYLNSPIDYLANMPMDHPYLSMYRNRSIVLCTGQGAWEHPMLEDARRMQQIFQEKQIPAWVDFWGGDVAHDWPWWKKQLPYFLFQIWDSLS